MNILGINTDKLGLTNDELRHAIDVLKISDLSSETIQKAIKNVPSSFKEHWLRNPNVTGALTAETIETISNGSFVVGVDDMPLTRSEMETIVINQRCADMDLVIGQKMTDDEIRNEVENANIDDLIHACYDMDASDIEYFKENDMAIDAAKIFSDEYAAVIMDEDKKAYDLACGAFESSIDRQAAHHDNFYKAMSEKENCHMTQRELNYVSELVNMGNYSYMRATFITSEKMKNSMFTPESVEMIAQPISGIEKQNQEWAGRDGEHKAIMMAYLPGASLKQPPLEWGGKFVVSIEGDTKDYGTYLQSKTSDLASAVGDDLGLPETTKQSIFITPSTQIGNKHSFMVIVSDAMPEDAVDIAYEFIKDELRAAGANLDGTSKSENYRLLPDELKYAGKTLSNEALGLTKTGSAYRLPKEARVELEHAAQVMKEGYVDGYNADGYDETGHSADGDYNAMYDNAFTDAGPDF